MDISRYLPDGGRVEGLSRVPLLAEAMLFLPLELSVVNKVLSQKEFSRKLPIPHHIQ